MKTTLKMGQGADLAKIWSALYCFLAEDFMSIENLLLHVQMHRLDQLFQKKSVSRLEACAKMSSLENTKNHLKTAKIGTSSLVSRAMLTARTQQDLPIKRDFMKYNELAAICWKNLVKFQTFVYPLHRGGQWPVHQGRWHCKNGSKSCLIGLKNTWKNYNHPRYH